MKLEEGSLPLIYPELIYDISSSINQEANTLIITTYTDLAAIPEKNFLLKILNAVGLSDKDIHCVKGTSKSAELLTDYTRALIFGPLPFEIGIKEVAINLYEAATYNDCQCVFADTLDKIQNDKSKKEGLWLNMKRIFQ